MADRGNNNNNDSFWTAIKIGAGVIAGVGALAYALSNRDEQEGNQPQRNSARVVERPSIRRSASGVEIEEPTCYEDYCAMQTPGRTRVTYVVETVPEWNAVKNILQEHCRTYRVLGFDCEKPQGAEPALLQLATHKGVCFLIRICELPHLPKELREIMASTRIIKVGVGVRHDADLLDQMASLDFDVNGVLDLRFIGRQLQVRETKLRDMAQEVLNYTLHSKRTGLTNANWTALELDKRHVDYAAEDALAGIEIFKKLEGKYKSEASFFETRNLETFLDKFKDSFDRYYNY